MKFPYLRKKIQSLPLFYPALRVTLSLLIAFSINQLELYSFESWFYDVRVRLSPQTPVSGHIKTIEINNQIVANLNGEPDIKMHAKLLKTLAQAKPKAVVYILDLDKAHGSEADYREFVAATKKLNNFVLTSDKFIAIKGLEDELRYKGPLHEIPVEMALITKDDNKFARDGVTRRVLLSNFNEAFFHHKLAKEFNGIENVKDYKGAFKYVTSMQTYIDFRRTGTYKADSFTDVAEGKIPFEEFQGKIVLVGRNTLAEANDYKMTPYSREVDAMSSLEVHANMLDTLILNSAPIQPINWVSYLLTILISIVIMFSVFSLKPLNGLIVLASTLVSFLVFSLIIFISFKVIIDVSHVLLAIFVCYYFFIPYRLIIENKKSWEYQQRNKILKKVEELKSNFMRMMSHDLKTPLARIQGMTEIAINDKSPLSNRQLDALKTINRSSLELSEFISSILDLSRVESNEVKLQTKSKDINDIILQVTEKFQYLAKEKNINLKTELEPIFSVKIDEDLIKQVFTNLIENAIKYSPENSNILITTEEVEDRVLIQVADQGKGILPYEQQHVFDKFFRSSDAQASNIMGSGLGLYLSKYFVELHSGNISVESEVNHGSTFSVELPMDMKTT